MMMDAAALGRRGRLWRGVCLLLFGSLGVGVFVANVIPVHDRGDETPISFTVFPPQSVTFARDRFIALSPDGTELAFTAVDQTGETLLWIRSLNGSSARALPGTSGAARPFWSPDGGRLGFFAEDKLKTVALDDGTVTAVCDALRAGSGTWNNRGAILFSRDSAGPLYRVPEAGGDPVPVTELDPVRREASRSEPRREIGHRWPYFLPDDRHFLYVSESDDGERLVYLGSLESDEKTSLGVSATSNVAFAQPGYLVFVDRSALVALAFHPKRLRIAGGRVIARSLGRNLEGDPYFSVSRAGTLAYWHGREALVWVDRNGRAEPFTDLEGEPGVPRLSPDGKWLAVTLASERNANENIWLYGLGQGTWTQLTHVGNNSSPVWTPDSTRVTFQSDRAGGGLYSKGRQRNAEATLLVSDDPHTDDVAVPGSWSPDGRILLFSDVTPASRGYDIFALPTEGTPRALIADAGHDLQAAFSPDGHWLAYVSYESPQAEVFVQSYVDSTRRWQVSANGGWDPVWSADGEELFYRRDSDYMTVGISTAAGFVPQAPRLLFRHPGGDHYDASPDGQRFILVHRQATEVRIVLNWDLETETDAHVEQ